MGPGGAAAAAAVSASSKGEGIRVVHKKRAFKPKVKTGCLTCRKRRIKCDENKPVCLKCKRSGFDCDGYQPMPNAASTQVRQLSTKQAILPKYPNSNRSSAIPSSDKQNGSSNLFQPPTVSFKSEQEHRYYRVFCENIAYQLAGYHDFPLWNYLILQAADQEPSIRHAVIAIGALERTRQTGSLKGYDVTAAEMDEHHIFAIKQYSKAIREMRDAIANRVHNLRTTLLTCLLIICFESFHGNHESALNQIQAGLRLLEEWVGNKVSQSLATRQQSRSLSPQSEDSQTSSEAQSLFDISSPAPDTIEDEIIHAFSRLDMQAISFLDPRPITYHRLMKNCGSEALSRMPLYFSTLHEARGYYELIMRRMMHWISTASDFRRNVVPEAKVKMDEQGGMGGGGMLNSTQPQIEYITPEGRREQQEHLAELDHWHELFLPIYHDLCHSSFTRNWLAATVLELKWITLRLGLNVTLGLDMTIYDDFLDEFRESVRLAKVLFSYPQTLSTFAFDLGMIPQLFLVGTKCRDPVVRREAIWLLLSTPRREGVWDSVLAGKMATVVMEIEEAEMVDGYVPGWARVRGTKMDFNLLKKEGTLILLMSQRSPGGGVKVLKRSISW